MRGLASIVIAAMSLCGCSIGVPTVERDRFDYASTIGESWKEIMLLNIVKLRYAEAPVFLEVASVIEQYSIEGTLNAGGQFPGTLRGGDAFSAGAGTRYGNRPTITYQPLYGERFTRSLLTPMPPHAVFSMVQGGWGIDNVFRACVRTVNGIRGPSRGPRSQPADPRWAPLLEAFRRLDEASAVDVRVTKVKGAESVLLVIGNTMNPEVEADALFIRKTLGLEPKDGELRLVFGSLPRKPNELAMLTRSMLEILLELSYAIEAPPEHLAEGRASLARTNPAAESDRFRIQSSNRKPDDAFVAVKHRGYWFWIDDRDWASKRTFSLLSLIGALAESGSEAKVPAVTISAGP